MVVYTLVVEDQFELLAVEPDFCSKPLLRLLPSRIPSVAAASQTPITQQVEVISLVGDIGLVNRKPVVHAHGVVGLEDGTTRGGHIISAILADA